MQKLSHLMTLGVLDNASPFGQIVTIDRLKTSLCFLMDFLVVCYSPLLSYSNIAAAICASTVDPLIASSLIVTLETAARR